ncbi:hypothetical protein QEG98_04330 [Myxococcus sp. MxC21-1]|nr:hypothetical protein QEG98_04330 [Myxococcus sp. MxC21-1]
MDVLPTLRRSLVIALALLLTACPRSTRTPSGGDTGGDLPSGDPFPTRPSVEAKKDPTADAALAQASQTASATPDKKKAAEAYLSVRKAYPATTAGQDALYQAGVLFFESRDFVNARKSFNELLFENPLHARADDAKHKLAISAMEVGAYRDAYQTLSSLAERASGAERTQLLNEAARAAEGAGLYGQALQMAVDEAGRPRALRRRPPRWPRWRRWWRAARPSWTSPAWRRACRRPTRRGPSSPSSWRASTTTCGTGRGWRRR